MVKQPFTCRKYLELGTDGADGKKSNNGDGKGGRNLETHTKSYFKRIQQHDEANNVDVLLQYWAMRSTADRGVTNPVY